MQSLKTTAGAMLISAAFFAFRPLMPSSELQLSQPTQVAREDAANGAQPCPRPTTDSIESVTIAESDEMIAARCHDRRGDTAESTAIASAPIADAQSA